MIENALRYSHTLLKSTIINGDKVIDATVGNGGDTVLLAKLVGKTGHLFGFDVQAQAIKTTKEKLLFTGLLQQVSLYNEGHEKLNLFVPANIEIAAAVFNLGYLPTGDKQIITKGETTIQAIEIILPRLRKGGLIVLTVYSGHPEGDLEKSAILEFTKQLSQDLFTVLYYGFINQKNSPPFLIAIEKR
ncbi:tRNA (mnm(5)s(2)U34)-methyltransferase [Carnobacterium funditum]|uniref:tRNA (mnm(5)s(2)U34)-methyltransferase n=1 Tax=Carnobacterium funditum TaxID=2752 RepID=UPI00054E2379|nr:class I SAM-dependent methyltransferase [Carnobacterium funditum]